MSTASLSIGLHGRYTPELRDRILGSLQEAMLEATYHLPTQPQLRSLAEVTSSDAPILSLYLQLSPERRIGSGWTAAFTSLRDQTLKPIEDRRERLEAQGEFDRIGSALEDELPSLGRGVAFFSCRARGFWRQIAVPVPLPDGSYLGPRPHLQQLAWTQDEQDRFLLVLLSQGFSRFFTSQIGQVEEILQVKGASVREMVADQHGPPPEHHHTGPLIEALANEARVLAHITDLVLTHSNARYCLLSGTPELRAAVAQQMPKEARRRLAGNFSAELHARPAEIAAASQPMQRLIEEREEVATVRRAMEAGPRGAALGKQPVCDALREGRVMTLVVEDAYREPGTHCPECGGLWAVISPGCLACGGMVEVVQDIAELAIDRALQQRAGLEIVRSGAGQRLMRRTGPMAALLRW